jgi:hypothetical protein
MLALENIPLSSCSSFSCVGSRAVLLRYLYAAELNYSQGLPVDVRHVKI